MDSEHRGEHELSAEPRAVEALLIARAFEEREAEACSCGWDVVRAERIGRPQRSSLDRRQRVLGSRASGLGLPTRRSSRGRVGRRSADDGLSCLR
ncbi:Hypothetical protein A7982_02856 [Minicystis rosea]|nr:Hypothetical protein A7982_02856 [Minicystis rosea]